MRPCRSAISVAVDMNKIGTYIPPIVKFSLFLSRKAREGDHRPKIRWRRGRAASSADRTGCNDSTGGAFPLHHALCGARSPSPALRERKGVLALGQGLGGEVAPVAG